ncbi:hypothetical protein [Nocardia nova]|uniref:hypothetical protein n=1 Tax=Nocardia nova TaxID=37330 RepID=UPI00189637DB|nr:hypothetical protein [Nocardia nova]MBF6278071.1 hypothetical protein [Nocardia nova]
MIRNLFRRNRASEPQAPAIPAPPLPALSLVPAPPLPPAPTPPAPLSLPSLTAPSREPIPMPAPAPSAPSAAELEAKRLQARLFELYDMDNSPDIVWTEDGPEYGDTFDDAEDPALQESIKKAEAALDDHLNQHRAELADIARWKPYYELAEEEA